MAATAASRAHRPLVRVAVELPPPASAEKTLLPSAAGGSLAPGQRRNCFSFGPGAVEDLGEVDPGAREAADARRSRRSSRSRPSSRRSRACRGGRRRSWAPRPCSASVVSGNAPRRSAPFTRWLVHRHVRERREALDQLDQVVVRAPGARSCATGRGTSARRRARTGAPASRNGPSRLAAGFAASTNGSTSSSAAAQVHEGRVGAAHERREPLHRLGQRVLLAPERPEGRVQVAHDAGEVVAPLGERVHEACPESTRNCSSSASSRVSSWNRRLPVLKRRVQVVDALAQLLAAPAQHRRPSP